MWACGSASETVGRVVEVRSEGVGVGYGSGDGDTSINS